MPSHLASEGNLMLDSRPPFPLLGSAENKCIEATQTHPTPYPFSLKIHKHKSHIKKKSPLRQVGIPQGGLDL